MEIPGIALAGLYAIVATASASAASAQAAGPGPVEGIIPVDCAKSQPPSASVSKPNTTVSVTCAPSSTIEPSAPEEDEAGPSLSGKTPVVQRPAPDIYLGAECTQPGVLSSVCPGATVTPAEGNNRTGGPNVNVFFPQLPTSAQIVCLKCKTNGKSEECKAVINVAAAPPQGPQACAVAGTSVTLQINEAGGSAQFACGKGLTLLPSEATTAYADDCSKEETLKDMTRTPGPGPADYSTLKVNKLKKRKVCYLCKGSVGAARARGEEKPCTIYVEVSGSTRVYSSVSLGVALLCVAAMLRLN